MVSASMVESVSSSSSSSEGREILLDGTMSGRSEVAPSPGEFFSVLPKFHNSAALFPEKGDFLLYDHAAGTFIIAKPSKKGTSMYSGASDDSDVSEGEQVRICRSFYYKVFAA